MAAVSPEQLSGLLRNPNGIRNICILAHVDHGKTTLSDSLISSNGIISAKLAGKVRYLDFRPDEQLRGITMKSCSISLMYSHNDKPFLVNLIDSPGHVDFCSEVSTAVRLSDGAVVLVDVLEGVCTQTQSVLRQAWMEGVRPCLMLNKVDRLITELMLTPVEAYTHVVRIIEHINALMSHLHTEEHFANLSKAAVKSAAMMERDGEIHESDVSADDELDDSLEFSPAKGNVIFGSAYDGWAFSIDQFAKLYASKLGFAERVLRRTLWGNYVFEPKSKTIFKRSKGNLKPMFAQFIFEPIWEVYRCAQSGDQGKLEKITKSLNLTVPARELQHSEPQVRLKAVMSRWLPVAPAVLAMAVAQLPSPLEAQVYRTAKLVGARDHAVAKPSEASESEKVSQIHAQTEQDIVYKCIESCSCDTSAPAVAFVGKMLPVPRDALPFVRQKRADDPERRARLQKLREDRLKQRSQAPPAQTSSKMDWVDELETSARRKPARILQQATPTPSLASSYSVENAQDQHSLVAEQTFSATDHSLAHGDDSSQNHEMDPYKDKDEVFIAFARVFSGVLRRGMRVNIIGSRGASSQSAEITDVLIMMGRQFERIEEAPAGSVVGIAGLDEAVLKFATISSVPQCPPFAPLNLQSAAVVRVAVEPSDPSDMPKLKQGLRLLNQADPSISITLQETGEHVIAASGELHLEICVKDLRERFAKTAIEVSAPLVSFRETVAADSRSKPVQVKTANGACTITIRAAPLPGQIQRMIDDNIDLLKRTFDAKPGIFDLSSQGSPTDLHALEFAKKLKAAILGEEQNVRFDPSCVWAMGPRRVGPNFLVSKIAGFKPPLSVFDRITRDPAKDSQQQQLQSEEERIKAERINEIEASIITGFQAATLAGPLCEEPMSGVSLIVESIEFSTESPSSDGTTQYGPFTGQVIAATKEACRQAFLASAPRLVEALFFCDIQSTGSALGNVYAVLSKRRARILKEDMKEGTPIFTVEALLPVVESFGFVDDLRKKTSGAASAQLHFSHWEALPQDPMQQDVSQEDEDDENEEGVNVARNYMNAVRRRKGLPVEEKIIQHAEKQRTLAKKV